MKRSWIVSLAIAAIVVLGISVAFVSAPAAQNKPAGNTATKPATATTPRLADGHPDFSGFYDRDIFHGDPNQELAGQHFINRANNGNVFYDYAGANEAQLHVASDAELKNPPPYKSEYLAKVKAIQETAYGGTTALDPQMDCKPLGVPRGSTSIMQVVHRPEILALIYEANPGPAFRLIYTDGRTHPKDLDTSYFGHSIGHWEGDTLVVDVVGLNDETWLGGGQGSANNALFHTDKEHVIEKWSRNGSTLSYQATVEDPVMFTKPWVMDPRRVQLANPDDYMQAQMCVPNDRDHLIRETEKDKFLCGWCNPEAAYGVDSQKITTGQNVPENLKEGLKTKIDAAKDKQGQ
jgi:hypothetical protein